MVNGESTNDAQSTATYNRVVLVILGYGSQPMLA